MLRHFIEDYLDSVRNRTSKATGRREFPVGRLVVVKSEADAPSEWPIGVIVGESTGIDDVTRFIEVKVKGKVRKYTTRDVALIPRN